MSKRRPLPAWLRASVGARQHMHNANETVSTNASKKRRIDRHPPAKGGGHLGQAGPATLPDGTEPSLTPHDAQIGGGGHLAEAPRLPARSAHATGHNQGYHRAQCKPHASAGATSPRRDRGKQPAAHPQHPRQTTLSQPIVVSSSSDNDTSNDDEQDGPSSAQGHRQSARQWSLRYDETEDMRYYVHESTQRVRTDTPEPDDAGPACTAADSDSDSDSDASSQGLITPPNTQPDATSKGSSTVDLVAAAASILAAHGGPAVTNALADDADEQDGSRSSPDLMADSDEDDEETQEMPPRHHRVAPSSCAREGSGNGANGQGASETGDMVTGGRQLQETTTADSTELPTLDETMDPSTPAPKDSSLCSTMETWDGREASASHPTELALCGQILATCEETCDDRDGSQDHGVEETLADVGADKDDANTPSSLSSDHAQAGSTLPPSIATSDGNYASCADREVPTPARNTKLDGTRGKVATCNSRNFDQRFIATAASTTHHPGHATATADMNTTTTGNTQAHDAATIDMDSAPDNADKALASHAELTHTNVAVAGEMQTQHLFEGSNGQEIVKFAAALREVQSAMASRDFDPMLQWMLKPIAPSSVTELSNSWLQKLRPKLRQYTKMGPNITEADLQENHLLLRRYVEARELLMEQKARQKAVQPPEARASGSHATSGTAINAAGELKFWRKTHTKRSAASLSASTVGRFYHLKCDLFLRLKMWLNTKAPGKSGNPKTAMATKVHQELTDHRLLGGQKFEDHLIASVIGSNIVRVPLTGGKQGELGCRPTSLRNLEALPNEDAKMDEASTLYALMTAPVGSYVYQACFKPPQSIVRSMGIVNSQFRLSQCYTDFLQILPDTTDAAGKRRWIKIIDAKNSAGVSHTHQLQVAFYALAIKHVLADQGRHYSGLQTLAVHPMGAIWLRGNAEPVDFRLDMPVHFIDMFLRRKLQGSVLQQSFANTRWGLVPECRGCDFQKGCKARAESERCVSLVPGTPRRFKNLGDAHVASGSTNLHDIEDTAQVLQQHAADWPSYGFADYSDWSVRRQALVKKEVLLMGTASATLPAGEEAVIMVTVLVDSVTDNVVAFAVSTLQIRQDGLPQHLRDPTHAAISFSPADVSAPFHQSNLALQLIDALMEHMDDCARQKLHAHVYTFDAKERTLLSRLLISVALDGKNVAPALSKKAYIIYTTLCGDQDCLRLADNKPPPDRLRGSQQQITVLLDEIRTLLAFPRTDVAIDFDTCWEHLYRPNLHDTQWYADQCFNSCSQDLILLLWLQGTPGDAVADHCVGRTVASAAILGGMRTLEFKSAAGGRHGTLANLSLLGKPVERFAVAVPITLSSDLLQKMVFTSQLDVIEACGQVRQTRLLSKNHRVFSGKAIVATVVPQPPGIEQDVENEAPGKKNALKRSALVWAQVDSWGGAGLTIKPTGFPEYLLTAETEAGDEKHKKYDDIRHFDDTDRILPLPCFVAIAHVLVLSDPKKPGVLRTVVGMRPASWRGCKNWKNLLSDSGLLNLGSRVFVQRRYHNGQYAKMCSHFDEIDPSSPPFRLFEAMVRNSSEQVLPGTIAAADQALGGRFTTLVPRSETDRKQWPLALSASQHAVLEKVARGTSPVSVVWGPPGTGKTHFLGLLILYLLLDAAERPEANQNVRILVGAQNHLAIENVISAVVRLRDSCPGAREALANSGIGVAKVCRPDTKASDKPYTVVPSKAKEIQNFFGNNESCVVGATVWAVQKMPAGVAFDVVILDEASQLAVSEASIPILRVSALPGSRVILAGDHKQLPPISAVDFSKLSMDREIRPRVWTSIFECVMEQSQQETAVWPHSEVVGTMLENRRMSAALCQFPIKAGMYEKNYRPDTEEVGCRHFVLQPSTPADGMACISLHANSQEQRYMPVNSQVVDALLPDIKLRNWCKKICEWRGSTVVVRLGGPPGPAWLDAEAKAVSYLATFLRLHMPSGQGSTFAPLDDVAADKAFWAERLAIITPHHAQRLKISGKLKGLWDRDPKTPMRIETVEKIQGQEADVVISCFGFNDPEQLSRELDFVYDPRRINVSMTRAKRKNIIIIGNATLFSPSPALLEDTILVQGFNYLHRVQQQAEAETPDAKAFTGRLALSTYDLCM